MSKEPQRETRRLVIFIVIVGLWLALSALNVWAGRAFAAGGVGWAAGDLSDWIELRTRHLIEKRGQ